MITRTIDEGGRSELSEGQRRRGLIVMLVDTFLMWGGFFIVIPLISVHYVQDLGWDAGAIGLVLGARQLFQQGLTLMGGALADKLGVRGLIAMHVYSSGELCDDGLCQYLPIIVTQRYSCSAWWRTL